VGDLYRPYLLTCASKAAIMCAAETSEATPPAAVSAAATTLAATPETTSVTDREGERAGSGKNRACSCSVSGAKRSLKTMNCGLTTNTVAPAGTGAATPGACTSQGRGECARQGSSADSSDEPCRPTSGAAASSCPPCKARGKLRADAVTERGQGSHPVRSASNPTHDAAEVPLGSRKYRPELLTPEDPERRSNSADRAVREL